MNNSKEFWGQIRKYRHRTLISNDISREEWVDHFDKVFNENTTAQVENAKKYGNPGNDEESYDEILDTDISELEVKKAIQRLKSGKAAGVDRRNAKGCRTRNNTFSDKILQCPLLKFTVPI